MLSVKGALMFFLLAYRISRGDLCGGMKGSVGRVTGQGIVCLQVDQVEVGGGEVGAQSHVRVLQLAQDPPVELGADPVELHYVAGILLDPETVELLHQVTCREEEGKKNDSSCVSI